MIASGSILSAGRISFGPKPRTLSQTAARSYHALHRSSSPVLFAIAASRSKPPSTSQFPGHTQLQTRRPFSAISALETTLTTTQHLFTELHNVTGTPWFLTIPLVALSINLVCRFPLSIYVRRIAMRRAKLKPLFQAWTTRHAQDIMLDPKVASKPQPARGAEIEARVKKTSKRIFKTWGVQRYKDFSALGVFPVWLISIEALRRMCGGPRGLIGSLVFGPDEKTALTGEAIAASSSPIDAVSVVDIAQDIILASADPSLATGGCLWFPDLMVADPLHILPLALSAVLVLNILPPSQAGIRRVFGLDANQHEVIESKTPQRLTRALLIMALAIGPATMDLPAALHLYWLSSATLTLLQAELLAKIMPMPKEKVKPCSKNESIYLRPARPETKQS